MAGRAAREKTSWARAGLVALALLACPAAASGADRTLAADPTATDISGFGGTLVWSREESPGRFRLVERRDGLVADAPVAPFSHPVDADLGPGRDGGVVAVYARCPTSRSCDVFELDVATGREREVAQVSSVARAEATPSVWRGRYAFTRTARASTSEDEFDGPGIEPYAGGGLLASSPMRRLSAAAALETDVRGRHVAFRTGVATTDGSTAVHVRSLVRGGRTCTVAEGVGEGGLGDDDEVVTSPVLAGGYVHWAHLRSPGRFSEGAGETTIHRVRVPGPRCQVRGQVESSRPIVRGPRAFSSIAVSGDAVAWTTQDGVVEASEPLAWTRR